MGYRYETHLHTYPVSRCGKADVYESLDFYKQNGYAEHYDLLKFAGSDNHHGGGRKNLAGMAFAEPIGSEADFVEQVKSGRGEIFTLNLE